MMHGVLDVCRWKQLVKLGKSRDGHAVPENFEEEKRIMKYLSGFKDSHPGFVKLLDEWEACLPCYFPWD